MLRSMSILAIAMLVSLSARSQDTFIQFIADGLASHEEVTQLMASLNEREGIVSSRAEFYTDNVVLFLNEGTTFSRDEIAGWPEFEQYSVLCFRKGVVGADLVLRLRKEDCNNQVIDKEE